MSMHYIPLTGYNQTCSTVQSCSPNLLGGLDILPEEVTFSLGFVATGGVSELVVFASSVELVSELHSSVFLSSDDTFALFSVCGWSSFCGIALIWLLFLCKVPLGVATVCKISDLLSQELRLLYFHLVTTQCLQYSGEVVFEFYVWYQNHTSS